MTYEYQSLNFNLNTDDFITVLQQIDARSPIVYDGDPTGVLAANFAPVFCKNSLTGQLYYCSQADGTVAGTTWVAVNFTVFPASTTQAGIVELAEESDVASGTDTTKAVTSATLSSVYAKNGENTDITKLLGLTTPLSAAQGGTGYNSTLASLLATLPTLQAYQYLSNDGTNLTWSALKDQILTVSMNGNLQINTLHIITVNSLTLVLPATTAGNYVLLQFDPSVTAGPLIEAPDSLTKIYGSANSPMNVDNLDPFGIIYTGTTYGWILKP